MPGLRAGTEDCMMDGNNWVARPVRRRRLVVGAPGPGQALRDTPVHSKREGDTR